MLVLSSMTYYKDMKKEKIRFESIMADLNLGNNLEYQVNSRNK